MSGALSRFAVKGWPGALPGRLVSGAPITWKPRQAAVGEATGRQLAARMAARRVRDSLRPAHSGLLNAARSRPALAGRYRRHLPGDPDRPAPGRGRTAGSPAAHPPAPGTRR